MIQAGDRINIRTKESNFVLQEPYILVSDIYKHYKKQIIIVHDGAIITSRDGDHYLTVVEVIVGPKDYNDIESYAKSSDHPDSDAANVYEFMWALLMPKYMIDIYRTEKSREIEEFHMDYDEPTILAVDYIYQDKNDKPSVSGLSVIPTNQEHLERVREYANKKYNWMSIDGEDVWIIEGRNCIVVDKLLVRAYFNSLLM